MRTKHLLGTVVVVTRLGITIPLAGVAGVGDEVARLGAAGYTDCWTAETAGSDAFAPIVAAATQETMGFGTAIASVYARGPGLLAMQAATAATIAPGRFTLGIGTSSKLMTEGWNATTFDRPVARTRDTVRFLRAALAGEKVSAEFETFAIRSFRLEAPPEVVPPIAVAALRPAMLGIVLNWLAARDVPMVVSTAYPDQEPGIVAARIFVCCSEDAGAVRAAARRLVSTYLTVPTYEAFQRWLGRDALTSMWDAWKQGDRAGATDAVPDSVVDELILHGSIDACVEQVKAYAAAGVTVPVVKLLGLGVDHDLDATAIAFGEAWARR
jgi:probable F420-dependent oxidoreductase